MLIIPSFNKGKRQKSKSKDYVFEGSRSQPPVLPLDQLWATPNASTDLPSSVDIHCEDAGLQKTHPSKAVVEALPDATTMIDYQDLNSPYTSMFEMTPPATELLSIPTRIPITEQTDIRYNMTLRPNKNLVTQHVPSIRNTPMFAYRPTTSSGSPPYLVEEYTNETNTWTTPLPSTRTRKYSKGSVESHHQMGKRQHKASLNQTENPVPTKSSMPRVSSKAVEMITNVENLYEFGVNIGILPEDKETQHSLRRMKRRFISLLSQPCISESDSSRCEQSGDESDDT